MKRLLTTSILTSALLTTFLCATIASDQFIEQKELEDVLYSENTDRFLEISGQIGAMRYKGQILPFIIDLWEVRRDRYPSLPWDFISSDLVRIELAVLLTQAYQNGLTRIDTRDIHQLARRLIGSIEGQTARRAIRLLGKFDDPSDVARLFSLAEQQDFATFSTILMAFSMMCNDAVDTALEDLESSVVDRERLIEVQQTLRLRSTRSSPCDQGVPLQQAE